MYLPASLDVSAAAWGGWSFGRCKAFPPVFQHWAAGTQAGGLSSQSPNHLKTPSWDIWSHQQPPLRSISPSLHHVNKSSFLFLFPFSVGFVVTPLVPEVGSFIQQTVCREPLLGQGLGRVQGAESGIVLVR